MGRVKLLAIAAVVLLLAGAAGAGWYFSSANTRLTGPAATVARAMGAPVLPPAPAHVVVVIEENKAYGQIVGDESNAPYLNGLLAKAAVLTNSHGIAHPSQPNYMALFSGLANSDGDSCDVDGVQPSATSLGGELRSAHLTFTGYAEDLPRAGFSGCYAGQYARKHVPWTHFTDVTAEENQPFSALPSFAKLPTVAFVIPNLLDDMHSASIARGDAWLKTHLDPLIEWSRTHNSLIIITFDEDNGTIANHIPTLLIGSMIKPGRYDQHVTHYDVLRTIEDFYHLPALGASSNATPLTGIWRT